MGRKPVFSKNPSNPVFKIKKILNQSFVFKILKSSSQVIFLHYTLINVEYFITLHCILLNVFYINTIDNIIMYKTKLNSFIK